MAEEEIRRQEAAARDQADAGSPREETGKFFHLCRNVFNKLPSTFPHILMIE